MAASGRPLVDAALALARLETGGWLAVNGGWCERLPGGAP